MGDITLCFDFGNTKMKCGIFEGDQILALEMLEHRNAADVQLLIQKYRPHAAILSSVIDHDPEIENELKSIEHFIKLSHATALPFSTPVSRPDTIGVDRLAVMAYAAHFHPKENTLVIVLGSCITFNFLNQYDQFLGGSISPGMEMRFKAMNHFTAGLPLMTWQQVTSAPSIPLIGYDTATNLLSGVVNGMATEIDGIIDAYKEKFNKFNVLLTGGDTPNFVTHLKNKIFADPYLTLKGLYAISKYNHDIIK